MVWYANADDDEPDSLISFEPVYNSNDLHKSPNFLFDFRVVYTRAIGLDSNGDEDLDNLGSRTICQTHEFDKNWLLCGDEDQTQAIVYHILDMIDVPCYSEIVETLTIEILELKKRDAISALPNVERIEVDLNVLVTSFPDDDDDDVVMDVKFAVAPASEEAVEKHLETVVVGDEGCCAICMDKIRVGSDVAAGRMPCMHVFHRTCGEEWLRNSGTCPVCRTVFPS